MTIAYINRRPYNGLAYYGKVVSDSEGTWLLNSDRPHDLMNPIEIIIDTDQKVMCVMNGVNRNTKPLNLLGLERYQFSFSKMDVYGNMSSSIPMVIRTAPTGPFLVSFEENILFKFLSYRFPTLGVPTIRTNRINGIAPFRNPSNEIQSTSFAHSEAIKGFQSHSLDQYSTDKEMGRMSYVYNNLIDIQDEVDNYKLDCCLSQEVDMHFINACRIYDIVPTSIQWIPQASPYFFSFATIPYFSTGPVHGNDL